MFCRNLALFGYRATSAGRVVLLPGAPAIFLGVTTTLLGAITPCSCGSTIFGEFAPVESFVHRRGALQDAVRKNSSIGAVREDGLYVDTLHTLSHSR